ncbi:MAG: hypothetical protein ACJ780_04625 [Solirubrobacteraceae bacterium]
MNCTVINRRTAVAVTAALTLGSAGSAAARAIDITPQGSSVPAGSVALYGKANVPLPFVPRHMKGFPETTAARVAMATPRAVVNHSSPGDGSDLIYVLVGGVAFAGFGGAFAAGRHQRARTTSRPTIAA